MNLENKISIVLPTYNRINYLKISLETYLRTKRKDITFLIIDDCSTDGTYEYIKDLSKVDKRLKIFRQEKNKHINGNSLDGFKKVTTSFAMWLSDDDIMSGDYINECIKIFEKFPNVGIVHNRCNQTNKNALEEFNLYKAGDAAMRRIFSQGSAFPGLAYRMSCFNLNDWPEGREKIYPLVKMNILIAKNNDIVILNKVGLIEQDIGLDSKIKIQKKISEQNRSDDYNIGEMLSYLEGIVKKKLLIQLCHDISTWLLHISRSMSKQKYNIFLKTVSKNLGAYYFLFLIRLLYFRFDIKIFYFLIMNLLNVKLLKYNYQTLIFLLSGIKNKLFKRFLRI